MQLATLDWIVIALYGLTALAIGLRFARRAGSGADEFFLSGRKLPWWLLGTSMVATTFSTDTPNLIADFVRGGGVAQNWSWWAFLITGMCTVFFYARLWRRSGALTDIEFYELRYSGRAAAFLRGVPGTVPGRLLQRDDHRHGDARGHQDRRRAPGAGSAHHGPDRGNRDHDLLRDFGAVGGS